MIDGNLTMANKFEDKSEHELKEYLRMSTKKREEIINEAINGVPVYSDSTLAIAASMRKYTKVKLELLIPNEKFEEFSELLYKIKQLL
jgi:hypothetical protein